jgi:S-methylmethionine-dependent homocysteine/selenocysteine methylase
VEATDPPMTVRRLLAGSFGLERTPVRPDPMLPDWHEPPHVREPRAARGRLAAQVVAGADVIVAPTWLTHRRALLPVGETRQARAWTAAAVRLAREAVELGLEQRAEEASRAEEAAGAEEPSRVEEASRATEASRTEETAEVDEAAEVDETAEARSPGLPRPQPLVAAVLPPLDQAPDDADGRQLPREAAGQRDYHDQAGLLADAEPDLLLIESPVSGDPLRSALEAASDTGLPIWVALTGGTAVRSRTETVLDLLKTFGVDVALLTAPLIAATPRPARGTWGGLLTRHLPHGAELVERWLDDGAEVVGLLDGATRAALRPVRAAIDGVERSHVRELERAGVRWRSHVERAASMAPGGGALWLRSSAAAAAPPAGGLPPGFEWLVLDRAELSHLPGGRFRLIVDPAAEPGSTAAAARLLDDGGILAARLPSLTVGLGAGEVRLRLIELDDREPPLLAILRRER